MSRAVLVTGGTGFVGSHLARHLAGSGERVHLVTRPGSSLELLGPAVSRMHVHEHDGSTEGLIEIVRAAQPAVVFHLASYFVAAHRSSDVARLIESNVLFGSQLVEAMVANDIRSLVATGTSWQHFEDADYRPVSLYAATKQAFEDVLRFYTDATNIRAISLHLFDTYGSGDPRPKLLHLLRRAATTGETLAMSPGEQHLDLVHVDDVVQAFLGAAQRLASGEGSNFDVYAVSAGRTLSLRDVVAVFGRVSGRRLNIEWGGRPYRAREVMQPWRSGVPLPGWAPRIGLEEGIRRMLEDR